MGASAIGVPPSVEGGTLSEHPFRGAVAPSPTATPAGTIPPVGAWEVDGSGQVQGPPPGAGDATGPSGGTDGDDLASSLGRLAAETRADDAARERAREGWLRRQAEEEATFAGLLTGLAERGPVGIDLETGRRVRGWLNVLGEDYCFVHTVDGDVVLTLRAITAVRAAPDTAAPTDLGDRPTTPGSTLAELVTELAGDRPQVSVRVDGGERIAGLLQAAGRDVVTVLMPGERSAVVHIALAAIREIGLPDRR